MMTKISQQAAMPEHIDDTQTAPQYLIFRLSDERFALEILHVKEIIEYIGITDIPLMPKFLKGVINLRGNVVPIIDLAVRFNRKSKEIAKRTCIIIVELSYNDNKHDLGIIVDAVDEVIEISAENIEKAPDFGVNLRAEFILGMAKVNDKFLIILNPNYVLSINEMADLIESQLKQNQPTKS